MNRITPPSLFQSRRRIAPLFIGAVFLITSCSSFQTQGDFDRARSRIADGGRSAADIEKALPRIPEPLRIEAIRTVALEPGKESVGVLRRMLVAPQMKDEASQKEIVEALARKVDPEALEDVRSAVQKSPSLLSEPVATYLTSQKDEASAKILLDAVAAGRLPMTETLIRYFGEIPYEPAAFEIMEVIRSGAFINEGIGALARMKAPEIGTFLIDSAEESDNKEVRNAAVRHLYRADDRKRAIEILESILQNRLTEEEETVVAATRCSGDIDASGPLLALLKNGYVYDERLRVREAALESLARIEKSDPESVRAEMLLPEEEYLARFSVLRAGENDDTTLFLPIHLRDFREIVAATPRAATVEIAKKAPRPKARKKRAKKRKTVHRKRDRSALYKLKPEVYYRKAAQELYTLFGDDEGKKIRYSIHNALLSYSESQSGTTALLLRIYSSRYKGDEQKLRKRMDNGLHEPGILGTIVEGIQKEYPKPELAVYAFSHFFSVYRWQSQLIFEAVREGKF